VTGAKGHGLVSLLDDRLVSLLDDRLVSAPR
jgi:hypothetical protein